MKEQNAAHLTEGVSIHDAKKCSFSLKIPSPTLHQRNKNFFAGILKRDFSANQRFCYWNQQKSTMRNLVSKVSHWKMLTWLTSHLYFHVLLRSSCKAIMPKETEHLVERVAAYSCCWCQAEFNQSVWMYSF